MPTEIYLVRKLNMLAPHDAVSDDLLREIPAGEIVKAVISRPRNIGHHRLFFAMLNVVWKAQNTFATLDRMLSIIKVGTGHFETYELDGQKVVEPLSISFAKMDQAAFRQFFDKAVVVILSKILPGVGREDLIREVYAMIGEPIPDWVTL